jgi:surface polysaccharide O-acyltransferase-like enzyme
LDEHIFISGGQNRAWILWGFGIVSIAYAALLSTYFKITIVTVVYYSFFFITGIELSRKEASKKELIVGAITGLFSICWVVFNQIVETDGILNRWDGWQKPIIGFFISYMAIAFIRYFNVYSAVLGYLGRHSLEIYVMHMFVVTSSRPVYSKLGVFNYWVCFMISTFFATTLPLLASAILKKMHLWDMLFKPGSLIIKRKSKLRSNTR